MSAHAPLPDFRSVFLAASGPAQTLSFAEFMALALYDQHVGYYRRDRTRVGFGEGSDFYTASSSLLFGDLIAAACVKLLHGRRPTNYTFVELGAESSGGILAGVAHPFAAVKVCRVGEPLALSGPCVVFSNELFDAQPFRRFVRRNGAWRELGVALQGESFIEVELDTAPPNTLPADAPEAYVIDAPFAATTLAEQIAAQPWTGLWVACDYGKTWTELTEDCPAGTSRAYFRHTQSNDLLARPGEQDLTCHICWDWLVAALQRHRFAEPKVESQESFFIRHAGEFIAATSAAEARHYSPKKASLLQLLHPAHLGQRFQVLHAVRESSPEVV